MNHIADLTVADKGPVNLSIKKPLPYKFNTLESTDEPVNLVTLPDKLRCSSVTDNRQSPRPNAFLSIPESRCKNSTVFSKLTTRSKVGKSSPRNFNVSVDFARLKNKNSTFASTFYSSDRKQPIKNDL